MANYRLAVLLSVLLCCVNIAAGAYCYVWGDPHYQTFDGVQYTQFDVGDTYLVVADNIVVWMHNGHCGGRLKPTCNEYIVIQYKNELIKVTNAGRIYTGLASNPNALTDRTFTDGSTYTDFMQANGVTVTNFALPSATADYPTGYQVHIKDPATGANMKVTLQSYYLYVYLNSKYKGKVGGACGYYDGWDGNEFTTHDCRTIDIPYKSGVASPDPDSDATNPQLDEFFASWRRTDSDDMSQYIKWAERRQCKPDAPEMSSSSGDDSDTDTTSHHTTKTGNFDTVSSGPGEDTNSGQSTRSGNSDGTTNKPGNGYSNPDTNTNSPYTGRTVIGSPNTDTNTVGQNGQNTQANSGQTNAPQTTAPQTTQTSAQTSAGQTTQANAGQTTSQNGQNTQTSAQTTTGSRTDQHGTVNDAGQDDARASITDTDTVGQTYTGPGQDSYTSSTPGNSGTSAPSSGSSGNGEDCSGNTYASEAIRQQADAVCKNSGYSLNIDLLCECKQNFSNSNISFSDDYSETFYCQGLTGTFVNGSVRADAQRKCLNAVQDLSAYQYCSCLYDYNQEQQDTWVDMNGAAYFMQCSAAGATCYNYASCPNNCNFNGRCQNGKCLCDDGFSGNDCAKKELLNTTEKIVVITAGILAAIIIGAVAFVAISGYGGVKGYQYVKEHRVSGSHNNPLYNERPSNSNPFYANKA